MAQAPPIDGKLPGRVPPHDLEAEQSVLGAMLLDELAIIKVSEFLRPIDFYRKNHEDIYRAALELLSMGEPIDIVTVGSELEKMGVLERIGGRSYLAQLEQAVPTAANIEFYGRIVKEKATKRSLISAGGDIAGLGYDEAIDAPDALNRAQKVVFDISEDRLQTDFEKLFGLLRTTMERVDALQNNVSGTVGVPSGFFDLDAKTNGFKSNELVIIAGRPSMGKCLSHDMLVDDPVTGERITIKTWVDQCRPLAWGISNEGRLRPAAVADWVDSGMKPVFKVTTKTGRSVEVTGHHPFLTLGGWRPLTELEVGDPIGVVGSLPCFGSLHPTPDYVKELAMGLARAEIFPLEVWRWDREGLVRLIRAVFSAAAMLRPVDGHESVELTLVSANVGEGVHHALTRLGVVSSLEQLPDDSWHISVVDPTQVFHLRSTLGWRDQAGPAAWMKYASEGKITERLETFSHGEVGGRTAGSAVLEGPQSALRASPDIYWDPIVSIAPMGDKQVYDLTVPDGANFVAQDIYVHNTSLALNIALEAATREKVSVAIFSLEMSKDQLAERLLCEYARVDAQRLHRGLLGEAEHERLAQALGPLGEAPIFIDDSPMLDELMLLTKARRIKLQENVGMVIVDYLQLMHSRRGSGDDNRVQEVSQISRSMKALARELKVPVLALSQLSRGPEARTDKRPMLSDLRESGSIEQDADVVIFLYREGYYNKADTTGIAEVIVAKNRNGPTGTVNLRFRPELTRFENLDMRRRGPDDGGGPSGPSGADG
jgi:replicative DNA helicase